MRMPPLPHRLRDPHDRAARVDRRLVALIEHASRYLPEGWHLEVTSGLRPGATAGGRPSQHAAGLAIDVQLIDPSGKYIANKTSSQRSEIWRTYKQLADLVFHAQRLVHPELKGQLAWGGKFTLASGEWDVMHFDLGGFRGRGEYVPPAENQAPEIMVAELGGGDVVPPSAA